MSLLAAQEVSLVGESGFSSLVAVRRLLIVGDFPCCGSGAPAHVGLGHRLSCLVWARGLLLDQGPNPCPRLWQADS